MQGNAVSERFHVTGIVIGDVDHTSSNEVSVHIPNGEFAAGSAVEVVPLGDQTLSNPLGVLYSGYVIDSTHIGVRCSNVTAGSLSIGTIAADIYVQPPTGEQTNVVL